MRWVVTTACFVGFVLVSVNGRASPSPSPESALERSRRAFEDAHALYRDGRYRLALARYEEAYQLLTTAAAEARARIDRLEAETGQREALGAKYLRVKQEYTAFKERYGLVLEADWIAIADEITFERADWLPRTDELLDQFVSAMARERDEVTRRLSVSTQSFEPANR